MFLEYLEETKLVFDNMNTCSGNIELALETLSKAVEKKRNIFLCGNGGSAGDAQHWAAELVGVFRGTGKPIRAQSLTTDTSVISSIANDLSWEEVYSRQLMAFGTAGDILIAISTSGNSANVLRAMEVAAELNMVTVLVSGADGGAMRGIANVSILVPSTKTEIIQHAHLVIGHYLTGSLAERYR